MAYGKQVKNKVAKKVVTKAAPKFSRITHKPMQRITSSQIASEEAKGMTP